MGIYEDLETIVKATLSMDCCNTARGGWELRKRGSSFDLKYKGNFILLHNPAVSQEPTAFGQTIKRSGLDYNRMASILSLS